MEPMTRRAFMTAGGAVAAGAVAATVPGAAAARGRPPAPGGPLPSPPSLPQLSGDWMSVPAALHPPSVTNFVGGLQTTANLLSFDSLTLPPLAQGGECCALSVDGDPVAAREARWSAHEVARRGYAGEVALTSRTRMAFEQPGLLLEVHLTNTGSSTRALTVSVALTAYLREYAPPWPWGLSRPGDVASFAASVAGGGASLVVQDASSAAVSAFGFAGPAPSLSIEGEPRASWSLSLAAGQSTTLQIAMAAGTDQGQVLGRAQAFAGAFGREFAAAQSGWQQRWQAAFTPGNDQFSGSLPVLATDDPGLERTYYMSALTVLCQERTSYGLFPRAYASSGPEWGVTLAYFWDTSFIAPLLALLDPAMLRAQLELWLSSNIYGGYAVDLLTGQLEGPWYSANDLSVFTSVMSYVRLAGDAEFLDHEIAGSTVLEHLQAISEHWESLVVAATGLADYGGLSNLLEEVSDYVNQVPSLNAANVWMMRTVAALRAQRGEHRRAAALEAKAESLARVVLGLYVPGQGFWECVHDDGTRVGVRHIYDFDTVGRSMDEDLSSRQRRQMRGFFDGQLVAGDWIRALSLQDTDASSALRPDHGSNGAYDSWPALACSTLARFGDYEEAVARLGSYAQVTREGPFSQSHELTPAPQGVLVWDRPDLNPTDAITVAAWVEPASWPQQIYQGTIVSKDAYPQNADGSYDDLGYVLRGGDGGRISWVVATGGNYSEVQTTATVPTGGWHHVAGVYDGAQMVVYIDGQLAGQASASGTLTSAAGYNLVIGEGTFATDRRFTGAIAGVSLYDRALSAQEIAAAFAAGRNPSPGAGGSGEGPVLSLAIDEGHGMTTLDAASGTEEPILGGTWVRGSAGFKLSVDPASVPTLVRISPASALQDYNACNGGSFLATIVQDVFGLEGDGTRLTIRDPHTPRGFDGVLRGVSYRGALYDVASGPRGISVHPRRGKMSRRRSA